MDFYAFQDPMLFAGTIKSNLDPEGLYDEEQLWHVLRTVRFVIFSYIISMSLLISSLLVDF